MTGRTYGPRLRLFSFLTLDANILSRFLSNSGNTSCLFILLFCFFHFWFLFSFYFWMTLIRLLAGKVVGTPSLKSGPDTSSSYSKPSYNRTPASTCLVKKSKPLRNGQSESIKTWLLYQPYTSSLEGNRAARGCRTAWDVIKDRSHAVAGLAERVLPVLASVYVWKGKGRCVGVQVRLERDVHVSSSLGWHL